MKLLYDGRIFQMQKAGGINRYFAEIISGLPENFHPLITGVEDFGKNIPTHPNLEQPHFKHFRPGRISAQVRDRWWKRRLLEGLNLFHPTYYDLTEGHSFNDFKCPVVVTVHDLIYTVYPKLIEGSEGVIRHQKEAIRKADFLICVSKATENDLLEQFPEKRGKTLVVYHGSSFKVQTPLPSQSVFEDPYFLFVGGRGNYKNFSFLLRAFARASSSNSQIRLLVAGPPFNTEERWQIHLLGISERVESLVFPNEQQLMDLYRSSVALVYPSLHEGFGIPPLEAMACRTLAITSNTTCLPEIMGNAGIMLDPRNETDWVECILKTAKDTADRSLIIERGVQRVEKFSWKRSVEQHLEIYRQLV